MAYYNGTASEVGCPIRTKKIFRKRLCSPWVTDSLLNSANHKNWLEKQSVNDPALRSYYNSLKTHTQKCNIQCDKILLR